jgi:hypothetical protein
MEEINKENLPLIEQQKEAPSPIQANPEDYLVPPPAPMNEEQQLHIDHLENEIDSLLDKNTKTNEPSLETAHESRQINQEYIQEIISEENKRYTSPEALNRSKRIDQDFPPGKFETFFNKYKSQEKNLSFINPKPGVFLADGLEEGLGGHYQQQPPLVRRKHDFVRVTGDKANPNEFKQLLTHEYNHMVNQGHSNFSKKYTQYLRGMFLEDNDLKELGKQSGHEILLKIPYEGADPVYKYLTSVGEVNAYLGTNLRNDLLRNGVIHDFYDTIDENMIANLPSIKDSNCNKEETPIYSIYLSMLQNRTRLIEWLNNYAI